MQINKSRYINLQNGDSPAEDHAEGRYQPEIRPIHLAGKRGSRVWSRPRGITIEKGDWRERVPVLELNQILKTILYGLSSVLALVGLVIMIARSKGELNGGNA